MTTSLFKWKNDFSVGIKELDDQHKSFFEILNRLGEAAGGNKGAEVVGPDTFPHDREHERGPISVRDVLDRRARADVGERPIEA